MDSIKNFGPAVINHLDNHYKAMHAQDQPITLGQEHTEGMTDDRRAEALHDIQQQNHHGDTFRNERRQDALQAHDWVFAQ